MKETENMMLFFRTARERYSMLLRKRHGEVPGVGLTTDPIFREYRFCNVFREDDKVTTWFRENIRSQMKTETEHLRAAVAFRWFNLPATGELLLPWLKGEAELQTAYRAVASRQSDGDTILNAAYMIKSPPGMTKAAGLFDCLAKFEAEIESTGRWIKYNNTLEVAVERLTTFPYLGPFMAYQSVCDLRFTPLLKDAVDIDLWTSPGPGSARGMGRAFHSDPEAYNYNSPRDRKVLIEKMQYMLYLSRFAHYWPSEWPKWELSTVQHWSCEFDKYMREKNGEGHPKQKYRPAS